MFKEKLRIIFLIDLITSSVERSIKSKRRDRENYKKKTWHFDSVIDRVVYAKKYFCR